MCEWNRCSRIIPSYSFLLSFS
uniref:Uncharacterized protein n=1 Tax=Salix viminalis TaxID=40686 RepID=A0A6N2LXF0_SALVM